MLDTLKSVASLLASYGLLLVANGLFSSLLSLRTHIEGFAPAVTGLVMSAYFVGLLTGALFGANVVARVGHIRAFAVFASVMSVTALLHVIWVEPVAWAVMRAFSGFCMAGMVMVTESWLNSRADNRIRGQVLSLYMICNYLCAGLGQFLLPLAHPSEFTLFALVSILLSLALIPVLLTTAQAPVPSGPERGGFMAVYRSAPLGILGALCAGLVNAAFNGMGPVFAREVGLDLSEISAFMGTAIFGGLLLQWPVGKLSDRVDRRHILAGAATCSFLACIGVLMAVVERGPWLYVAAALYGSVAFTVYSLSAAHANDRSERQHAVRVASALLVAYGIGAALGPMLAGLSMAMLGPQGLFQQSAAVMAGLGFYSIYRLARRPAGPQRRPYVPMPGAQYTSEELYVAMRDQPADADDSGPDTSGENGTPRA